MKKVFKSLLAVILFAVILFPSIRSNAAVAPSVPTGLGLYGQDGPKFGLRWALDQNIVICGVNNHFGYEVTVTTIKGKKIGVYDKNSIDNGYDSDFQFKDNKAYMFITNSKMAKQAFKFKVRAYVYDETGAKLFSDYSAEKIIVPRAKVTNLKATSRSTGRITWKKIKGAKSYTVYVSSDGGNKYKRQGTTKGTTYTVKGMKLSKVYPVYVVANGIKVKKKKYNSTKPELKESNTATIKIYLTY